MAPRAVVWGLGRFGGGLGSILELERRGFQVAIMDGAPPETLRSSLEELDRRGARVQRSLLPESPASLEACDLLVLNPAIPPHHPLLRQWQDSHAASSKTSQEINLLLERLPKSAPPQTLAVTGTNGKSSTATLLHLALQALNAPTLLGGNIGHSLLLDPAPLDQAHHIVLELSSFQCARLDTHSSPRLNGLILTPITSDHLSWHGDLSAYHSAKLHALHALQKGTPIVFHPACPVGRRAGSLAVELGLRPIPAFQDRVQVSEQGELRLDGRPFFPGPWPCRGRFQRENLGLVLELLLALGKNPWDARSALAAFTGLPHRLQDLGTQKGVSLIDNGISTVAETTFSALRCLRDESAPGTNIHWVAGGKLKDQDLSPHLETCLPLCASAHFFGQAARAIEAHRPLQTPSSFHKALTDALEQAFSSAQCGDILLFSPAFSSHDQYANFEERCQEALHWWQSKSRKKSIQQDSSKGDHEKTPNMHHSKGLEQAEQ